MNYISQSIKKEILVPIFSALIGLVAGYFLNNQNLQTQFAPPTQTVTKNVAADLFKQYRKEMGYIVSSASGLDEDKDTRHGFMDLSYQDILNLLGTMQLASGISNPSVPPSPGMSGNSKFRFYFGWDKTNSNGNNLKYMITTLRKDASNQWIEGSNYYAFSRTYLTNNDLPCPKFCDIISTGLYTRN